MKKKMNLIKMYSWYLKAIIILLLATTQLVGNNYPEPFYNKKINLNNPDELLRMVRIIELYPLLVSRVSQLENEKKEIIDLSVSEKNILIEDFEAKNNYLKNRGKFWYYVAVIGIPVVGVVALAGGIYLGVNLGNFR